MIKDEISRQLFLNLTVTNENGTRPYFVFVQRLKGGVVVRTAKGPKTKRIWKLGVKPPEAIKPIPKTSPVSTKVTTAKKIGGASGEVDFNHYHFQHVPAEKAARMIENLFRDL